MTRPVFPVAVAGLSPELDAWLSEPCTCGHRRRHHHGPGESGACLAYVGTGEGRVNTVAGMVCPCSTFSAVRAAPAAAGVRAPVAASLDAPAPPSRSRKRPGKPESSPDAPVCSKCKDPARLAVERNGKRRIYCRPHGLAEALKVPRVEPQQLGDPLEEAWRAA